MRQSLFKVQEGILEALVGKLGDFYLSGGTALALYYFQHRASEDLDFFTQDFERTAVLKIISGLSDRLRKKVVLVSEQLRQDRARMMTYNLHWNQKIQIRLDFVEDVLKLIKPVRIINQIPVLSLEDIYLRKLFAITGSRLTVDLVGRSKMVGGRQEAKDFYDLYCLSSIFMNLSEFADLYCDATRQESLVHWFRTYDRLSLKTGLLDLRTKKKDDYRAMERHFKKEIDQLLEKGVDFL